MKTHYDGIVKVKKQELNEAQMRLLNARKKEQNIENKIQLLVKQMLDIEVLSKGSVSQLAQQREILAMQRRQKELLDSELATAKEQSMAFERMYEFANIEYEKMLYLKEEETKEYIKKLKKQESLELDEISLQLYSQKALS